MHISDIYIFFQIQAGQSCKSNAIRLVHQTIKKTPDSRRKVKRLHLHVKRRRKRKAGDRDGENKASDDFSTVMSGFARSRSIYPPAGLPLCPDDDRGAVHHSVGSALGLDFVGDHRIVLLSEALEHARAEHELLLRGRKKTIIVRRRPPVRRKPASAPPVRTASARWPPGYDIHMRSRRQADAAVAQRLAAVVSPPHQLPVNDDRAGPR